MLARSVAALALVTACKSKPQKPLAEAIIGEWEVLCRVDDATKSSCLSKEDSGLYEIFQPGGALESGSRKTNVVEHGHWNLTGDQLVLTVEGGGMRLTDEYRARMAGDRLLLWSLHGWGKVMGRVGAPFEAATAPTSRGKTTKEIGGIRYTISLPSTYRLARDDNRRQQWVPVSGDGFTVRLSLGARAQEEVDGKFVTRPCNEDDYGGTTGASETINGVERDTDIGKSFCLANTDLALGCSAGHTRGYLEEKEKSAALALCTSLQISQ
jgi:hypothetical protein